MMSSFVPLNVEIEEESEEEVDDSKEIQVRVLSTEAINISLTLVFDRLKKL